MNTDEARRRVLEDPDFVNLRRFNFSLKEVLARYPDGAPDRVVAQALMLVEEDVERIGPQVVERLRKLMGVEL